MIGKFFNKTSKFAILAGLAAGLYPLIFYYSTNYTLINSWKHLGFFMVLFIIGPMAGFWFFNLISGKKPLKPIKKYVLPFLSSFAFLFFLHLCLYASVQVWITVGILIVSVLVSLFLNNHMRKIVTIQYVLAAIGLISFVPTVIKQLNYSDEWMAQPDDIEHVQFNNKPNIYYIQPDGYINFSEINKGYYNIDNSKFEQYLVANGFKLYPDFRSNYNSTLVSNISTFSMKHHHYNSGFNFSETLNARDIIMNSNIVLNAFKQNGYKTHFLAEIPYFLINHPKIAYDVSNFSLDEISLIGTGLSQRKEIHEPLLENILVETEQPKFFFIEIFDPGHVPSREAETKGKEIEKKNWEDRLQTANATIEKAIDMIKEHDPNALIILMADHGGYVGMDYMLQARAKSQDRDQIFSIFSSQLAISWPDGQAPDYDSHFKSSVNLFRILFSYLSDNPAYLDHLEPNESFLIINKNAPKGVYRCIADDGSIVFDKL